MVRLKHNQIYKNNGGGLKSQFHYGSIKTVVSKQTKLRGHESQFHYGSIKTHCVLK